MKLRKEKKRQINCHHYREQSKKTSVYTYGLPSFELNLCNKCEKRLRKIILEQIRLEKLCENKKRPSDVKNGRKQNSRKT